MLAISTPKVEPGEDKKRAPDSFQKAIQIFARWHNPPRPVFRQNSALNPHEENILDRFIFFPQEAVLVDQLEDPPPDEDLAPLVEFMSGAGRTALWGKGPEERCTCPVTRIPLFEVHFGPVLVLRAPETLYSL